MPEEITKSEALAALLPSFSGSRTYLIAGVGIGVSVLTRLGYIPQPISDVVLPLLGFSGLATLRAAVTKSGPQPILGEVAGLVQQAIEMQPPCGVKAKTINPPEG